MKKVILVFLAVLTALSCIACAGNTPSVNKPMPTSPVQHPGSTEPKETEVSTIPAPVIDGGLSLEESKKYAKDHDCNLFVLHNEKFYPIDAVELSYGAMTASRVHDIGMTQSKEDMPVVSRSSGDQLVSFSTQSEYTVQKIASTRYCVPVGLNGIESYGLKFNAGLPIIRWDYHDGTKELNGLDVTDENVFDRLDGCYLWEVWEDSFSHFRFIAADTPTVLKAGYFSGTDWKEYDLHVDALTYYFPMTETVGIQQTKNGYFLVDISGLQAGKYVIGDGNHLPYKYAIELQ